MWDSFYHLGGIEREVMRASWQDRKEGELYRCLAWLYDGAELPRRNGARA